MKKYERILRKVISDAGLAIKSYRYSGHHIFKVENQRGQRGTIVAPSSPGGGRSHNNTLRDIRRLAA